jgi:hypothetical protein
MKPIDIPRLLEQIARLLRIEWLHEPVHTNEPDWRPDAGLHPPRRQVEELIDLGRIGHIRAIQAKLDQIGLEQPEHRAFVSWMHALVDRFDLDQYMATLSTLQGHESRSEKA